MQETVKTYPASIPCKGCGLRPEGSPSLVVTALHFEAFLRGTGIPCGNCGSQDLWESVVWALKEWPAQWAAPVLVSGKMSAATVTCQIGKRLDLDRSTMGIPPDAEIIHFDFTPYGSSSGAIALAQMPGHWRPGERQPIFTFIGVPVGAPASDLGSVSVAIWWASPTDIPTRHLITAMRAFIEGHFEDLILPANVAAETAIGAAMFAWVSSFVDKDRTENFLSDGATYSYQLNILSRILAHTVGAPTLNGRIRNLLDQLRRARNDLAHNGKLDEPLTKERAADLFAAAAFGAHYGRLLLDTVRKAGAEGRLPKYS